MSLHTLAFGFCSCSTSPLRRWQILLYPNSGHEGGYVSLYLSCEVITPSLRLHPVLNCNSVCSSPLKRRRKTRSMESEILLPRFVFFFLILCTTRWLREGLFKFSFDLKSVNKTTPLVFNTKEACDHAFSVSKSLLFPIIVRAILKQSFQWKTMNWGWAQFAKRDSVYYSATQQVRNVDAFLIVCTITSSPVLPTPPSVTPRQFVRTFTFLLI